MSRRQSSKRVLRPCQHIRVRCISETQTLAHLIPNLLLVLGTSLAPHLSCLDVGGTLIIGFSEHAHDRDENFLHALNGRPALGGMFIVVRVITRWVEDRDADCSIGVYYITVQSVSSYAVGELGMCGPAAMSFGAGGPTVWVPNSTSDKLHSRGAQRIVLGELELGCKHTTLEGSVAGALDQSFPIEHVILRDGASRDTFRRVCR